MRHAAFLLLLPFAAACTKEQPQPVYVVQGSEPQTCIECHRRINPGLVADHLAGPHQRIPLMCESCHGNDHDRMFAVKGAVSPLVCASCHPQQYEETTRSRHGQRLKEGKLDALLDAKDQDTGGCTATGGCHNIQRPYPDGGVGRCSACHITHAFRNREARDPRLCLQCHSGIDNAEYEMWQASAHGLPSPSHAGHVADCVTCHGKHDVSDAVLHGLPPLQTPNVPKQVPTTTVEEFESHRATMLARCTACHVRRFAKNALDLADLWKVRGALMLDEAAGIVEALHRDGLLDPAPAVRPPNPIAKHALRLGGIQFFDRAMSEPERIYYEMHLHLWPRLYRASYHTDPERVTWYLNDALKLEFDRLRAVDLELRSRPREPGEE